MFSTRPLRVPLVFFTVTLPSLIYEAVVEYDMMYSVASDNGSHVTSTLDCDIAVARTLLGAGKPAE